jgi:phenylacetate-CoA ligase
MISKFLLSIKSWLFFRLGDFLLGTTIYKNLIIQRKISKYTHGELKELQMQKLLQMLKHATSTSSFYSTYSALESEDPFSWLSKFPIINKKVTIAHELELISSSYSKKKLIKYETSGSSGIRSAVYLDKEEQSICRAILINWWEWNGYYLGKPMLQTGITPDRGFVKSIKDYFLNVTYLDAFALREEDMLAALKKVQKQNNPILFGYASSLYLMAQTAVKHKFNIKLDLAMSQGDKLFDHYLKEIKEAFGCKVVEDYGLNEGFMIGQKKDLPYFYIYTPNVFIEILDENNNPVKDGEMGRIIATKLDAFAMPLIRYDTGDLGIMLPKEKYPLKRDLAFPLLEKVVGRNTDIIKTKDGKNLIVHTFTGIFEFFPEIAQFQIHQNSLDSILVKFVPSETYYDTVLEKIAIQIVQRTQSDIHVIWEKVESIAPSKSGKPQLVVNNLISNSLSDKLN